MTAACILGPRALSCVAAKCAQFSCGSNAPVCAAIGARGAAPHCLQCARGDAGNAEDLQGNRGRSEEECLCRLRRRALYPHSPFGLVARLSATHKRAQTVSGPPQSLTRSNEVSGSQTDPLTPWYNGRAGIMPSAPSHIRRVSLEGKGRRT